MFEAAGLFAAQGWRVEVVLDAERQRQGFDLIITRPKVTKKVEVKCDRAAARTGRLYFEILRPERKAERAARELSETKKRVSQTFVV